MHFYEHRRQATQYHAGQRGSLLKDILADKKEERKGTKKRNRKRKERKKLDTERAEVHAVDGWCASYGYLIKGEKQSPLQGGRI